MFNASIIYFVILFASQTSYFCPVLTFSLPLFPCSSFHRKVLPNFIVHGAEKNATTFQSNTRGRIYQILFRFFRVLFVAREPQDSSLLPRPIFLDVRLQKERMVTGDENRCHWRTIFFFAIPRHSVYVLYNDEQVENRK